MSSFQWPFCAFSEEWLLKISYMNVSVREVFSLCPRNPESICKIIWLWASVRKESRTFCRSSVESLILKWLRNQSCCLSDVDVCWLCYCHLTELPSHKLFAASDFAVVDHSLTCVQLFATLWTAACLAPLSSTITQNLLTFVSIESVMLPNHLIPCHPLLLLPSTFTSIWFLGEENQNFFFFSQSAVNQIWCFPARPAHLTLVQSLFLSLLQYPCLDTAVYSVLLKKRIAWASECLLWATLNPFWKQVGCDKTHTSLRSQSAGWLITGRGRQRM